MKEINFTHASNRSIIDGTKTQTRRVIPNSILGNADLDKLDHSYLYVEDGYGDHHHVKDLCRWGSPGDDILVRVPGGQGRLLLTIKNIRVERLHDISESDAEAEGVDFLRGISGADETLSAVHLFEFLWDSIYPAGRKARRYNPYVWVIEFEKKRR